MINSLNFGKLSLILIISILIANLLMVETANFIDKYKYNFNTFTSPPTAMDFHLNYVAAKYLGRGLNVYAEHPETGMIWKSGLFAYGPIVAYFFLPFTIFSEPVAYRFWLFCIIIITLLSFSLFSKYFKDKYLFWATLLVITVFSYPFKFTLERGNIDHLTYLCLVLMFYFYADRRNALLTGLFLSMSILMKLYPGIFIFYFLIKKEWRIFLWSLLSSLILIFLTSSNNTSYVDFYKTVVMVVSKTNCWTGNHSLINVLRLIIDGIDFYKDLFRVSLQKNILMGIGVLILAGLYIATGFTLIKSKSKTIKTIFLEFSLLLILMIITAPISVDYNLIMLVFATVALLYYYQSLFSVQAGIKIKDTIFMGIFIYSTVYLYIAPVYNLPVMLSKSAPLLGILLHFLDNKFWPLMLHFFLIQYLLLREEKAKL